MKKEMVVAVTTIKRNLSFLLIFNLNIKKGNKYLLERFEIR